jgi:hypothetical protein
MSRLPAFLVVDTDVSLLRRKATAKVWRCRGMIFEEIGGIREVKTIAAPSR